MTYAVRFFSVDFEMIDILKSNCGVIQNPLPPMECFSRGACQRCAALLYVLFVHGFEKWVRGCVLKNRFSCGAFSMLYMMAFGGSLETNQQTCCCFCYWSCYILHMQYTWLKIFTALETHL